MLHSWNPPPLHTHTHTHPPPPPPPHPKTLLKGGQDFPNIESLGGVQHFLLEKEDKPEKERVDVEMGELPLFLLLSSSITFTLCVGKVRSSFLYYFLFFSLLIQPCKILIQISIVLKHCIICLFLIHSGRVQKMLTTLIKLVQNTQKTTQTNFFEYQGKMFQNIEKVLVKISEKQS